MNFWPGSFLKTRWLLAAGFLFTHSSRGAEPEEVRDFSAQFGAWRGSFVLYDSGRQSWVIHGPEASAVRTPPCSTFKVLNSLIFLETGVADGPDFPLKWDGVRREIEPWNQDQTLRSAFSVSCVWYFQTLASRVGLERYRELLPKAGYGNNDVSGGVTQFWLQSSMAISPREQVEFLRRLHARRLPFSERTVETVLDIMTLARSGGRVFRGKTGSGRATAAGAPDQGWFIGSVTAPAGVWCFATRITGGEKPMGATARKITEGILSSLKIFPEPD